MNYYNASKKLNIYRYDKNNVTIKFNLHLESAIDNIIVEPNEKMLELKTLTPPKDYDNPTFYTTQYPHLKDNDEKEFSYNKYEGTFLESVASAYLYSGDPKSFSGIGNNIIKMLSMGNGGGINGDRSKDLLDVLLEIRFW